MPNNKPPRPYRKLKAEDKAHVEQRQGANGFEDIDGLTETLKERGYTVSRTGAGRINAYLVRVAERIKWKQEQMTALINALGSNIADIGLVNAALVADAVQTVFERLDPHLQSLDFAELDATQLIKLMWTASQASRDSAATMKAFSDSKAKMLGMEEKERAAQAIIETMKQAQPGLSEETAAQIRAKILGIRDVGTA